MLEKKWKSLAGDKISDMAQFLRDQLAAGDKDVHIGTDSQQKGKFTEYVTVLVVLTPGKGGRVFFHSEKVPRIRSLRERLHKEVWMSTELAMELSSTPDIGDVQAIIEGSELTIHIDANPDAGPGGKFKSNEYAKELAGLVVGQGFKMLLKPDAWAAQHAADHAVKSKHLAPGRRR